MRENVWTDEEVVRFQAWYEKNLPHMYFTYQIGDKLVRIFRDYIKDNDCVLDYGAGLGFFSEHILKATKAKVSSCDFSPSAIQNERDRCSKYPNFSGAYLVDELIEQDKTFDVIFCLEVVEHCNDDYLKKTFENFKKLLRVGGIVIVSTPNNENLRNNFICCPNCGKVFHRVAHVRSWTINSLKKYIVDSGFTLKDIYTTNYHFKECLSKKTLANRLRIKQRERKMIFEKFYDCNDTSGGGGGYSLNAIFTKE